MKRLFVHLTLLALIIPSYAIASENLIQNSGFESGTTLPTGWTKGRWGSNTAIFTYPTAGNDGSRAAEIMLTTRTTGDAKWAFARVPIKGGATYRYENQHRSDVPTHLTAEFKLSSGALVYEDIGSPASTNSSWSQISTEFRAPQNATEVTVFHLINSVGTLAIDNVSLVEVPPSSNLIPNPSLEIAGAHNQPASWKKGGWGSNTRTHTYPVTGETSSRAARVEMTTYTNGDVKWYFDDVRVEPGAPYKYSTSYRSNRTTFVTVQFRKSDGSTSYLDLGTPPSSGSWTNFSKIFTVPDDVSSLTVFHLIKGIGFLEIDNLSLARVASDPSKLDKGYVSLNFDDGWRSVYDNAIPILDGAAFKSTQFITTKYLSPSYPGYMKPGEILELEARGHEIGAHTRSHRDLTTLSTAEAYDEIAGSRRALLDIGVSRVDTFAYPFGAYNANTDQIVRESGYIAARTSDGGYNEKGQDIYKLRRQSMNSQTTLDQAKSYIDTALSTKTWVNLLFHEVDESGHAHAVTPDFLRSVVEYLTLKNVIPITVREGVQLLSQ